MRYLKQLLLFAGALLITTSCHKTCDAMSPLLTSPKIGKDIAFGKTPFESLSAEEKQEPWGKEWLIGKAFALEGDYYRALTSFKRGLILVPSLETKRIFQFRFAIFLTYYHADKFLDAVETFERYHLIETDASFPGLSTLLTAAFHAYLQIGNEEMAQLILSRLQQIDPETSEKMVFFWAVQKPAVEELAHVSNPEGKNFASTFEQERKSPKTARMLNAVLPGAGYFYVGQKQTAATSLALNTIFLYTAYQLFDRGYTAMGIFVLSLESGWYFGGINGAGEAAVEYNEHLYAEKATPLLIREKSFPILRMEYTF